MTREEASRIDQLTARLDEVISTEVLGRIKAAETAARVAHEVAIAATSKAAEVAAEVVAHQTHCFDKYLSPMQESLKKVATDQSWLVLNAQTRKAEAAYRKRIAIRWGKIMAVAIPLLAAMVTLVVHFF